MLSRLAVSSSTGVESKAAAPPHRTHSVSTAVELCALNTFISIPFNFTQVFALRDHWHAFDCIHKTAAFTTHSSHSSHSL